MNPAIVIIQFECPHLLQVQLPMINKHLPGVPVYVYDNSRSMGSLYNNRLICGTYKANYQSLFSNEGDFSMHHSSALNYAFIDLRHKYDLLLFIDHDMFPFKETTILQDASNYHFAGYKQRVNGVTYLHPGFIAINTAKVNFVDFSPCEGLDTGGKIAAYITGENTYFVAYAKNEEIGYEIINDSFMHFVKGSNWTKSEDHWGRLDKLFEILYKL